MEALSVVYQLRLQWAPMLGVRKSDGTPNAGGEIYEETCESAQERRDRESLKVCVCLKS
jgi:hypothetical protein